MAISNLEHVPEKQLGQYVEKTLEPCMENILETCMAKTNIEAVWNDGWRTSWNMDEDYWEHGMENALEHGWRTCGTTDGDCFGAMNGEYYESSMDSNHGFHMMLCNFHMV